MSDYRTIITQLQWMKLSTMEIEGRTIVSQDINEWVQTIQAKIRSDIRTNLKNAPLPPILVKSLSAHVSQQTKTSVLWKELRNDIDVLVKQAQLLDTLLPTQENTALIKEKVAPTIKKSVATSPFSPSQEDTPSPPIQLILPEHLSSIQLELTKRLTEVRTNIAIEYGCSIPEIEFEQSEDQNYHLRFRKTELGTGHIPQKNFFALAPEDSEHEENLDQEPAYGKKGVWLSKEQKKDDWRIISPVLILESHIHEMIVRNIHTVFDWNAFNQIVAQLEENHADLIKKVLPTVLSRKQLFNIYTALLREDIPINNHEPLLKTIYAFRSQNKGTQFLVERIRRRLFDPSRIDANYRYATLSKPLEKLLRQALTRNSTKESFKIDDAIRSRIIQTITELAQQSSSVMLVMVPPPLRPAMQSLIASHNLYDMRLLSTDDFTLDPSRLFAELTLNEVLYR